MKLTYWYAQRLDDSDVYSVREKTKKAALASVKEQSDFGHFGPVVKVEVEYDSGFDLLTYATGEGGIAEEAIATCAATKKPH